MRTLSRVTFAGSLAARHIWALQALFWLALAVALPIGFHQFELSGRVYLPMHIPVLLAGFLAGSRAGLLTGLLAPILSHAITGMPPAYAVPLMTIELGIYGLSAGLFTYRWKIPTFAALLTSLLLGRVAFGLLLFALGLFLEMPYTAGRWFSSAGFLATVWPGILIQLTVIPVLVLAARKILGNRL